MITTPDAVPGEVIEAAWGDAVRSDLNTLDTGKFDKAGGNLTGSVAVTSGNLTVASGSIEATTGAVLSPAAFIRAGGDPTASVIGAQMHGANGRIHSMVNNAGNVSNIGLNRGGGSGSGDAGAQFVSFSRLGTIIGSVSIAANLTSVAYNTTSDKRTKRVTRYVEPDEALDKVERLEPVHYLTEAAPTGEQVGFLAQDAIVYAPEIVTVGQGEPGDAEFVPWMLDASKLVPTLVAAIQALTRRIQILEQGAIV